MHMQHLATQHPAPRTRFGDLRRALARVLINWTLTPAATRIVIPETPLASIAKGIAGLTLIFLAILAVGILGIVDPRTTIEYLPERALSLIGLILLGSAIENLEARDNRL